MCVWGGGGGGGLCLVDSHYITAMTLKPAKIVIKVNVCSRLSNEIDVLKWFYTYKLKQHKKTEI